MTKSPTSAGRDLAIVIGVAVVARWLFVALAPTAAISHDLLTYLEEARVLELGGNPYHDTPHLNYPPLWLQVLYFLNRAARGTGLPLHLVIRMFLIGADAGGIACVYALIRPFTERARDVLLVGMSLNPISILLVCQHASFDSFMILWVLLALVALVEHEKTRGETEWLAACLFLGLGILTKTVPVVASPLLAYGVARLRWRTRILGATLLFGPVVLGLSIIYVLNPADIAAKVFGYRSLAGWFGFSGIFHVLGWPIAPRWYTLLFFAWLAGSSLAAVRLLWSGERVGTKEFFLLALVLVAAVPALGPGFGPQYLAWVLPLAVVVFAAIPKWRPFLLAFWAVALAKYLVEYALSVFLGAFLVNAYPENADVIAASRWLTQERIVLLSLPHFFLYLALVGWGWKTVLESAHPEGPAPQLPATTGEPASERRDEPAQGLE